MATVDKHLSARMTKGNLSVIVNQNNNEAPTYVICSGIYAIYSISAADLRWINAAVESGLIRLANGHRGDEAARS